MRRNGRLSYLFKTSIRQLLIENLFVFQLGEITKTFYKMFFKSKVKLANIRCVYGDWDYVLFAYKKPPSCVHRKKNSVK